MLILEISDQETVVTTHSYRSAQL